MVHRLWARIERRGPEECWPWRGGYRTNGYGMFAVRRDGRWTQTTAHRAAYEASRGPVPDGWEVDHRCRNRGCCNPAHLDAVTLRENRARRNAHKTTCRHGHAFTPENTYHQRGQDGYVSRVCRTCRRERQRHAG